MPVLMAGRAPNDVARVDLHDGFAFALRPTLAGNNKKILAKRMGVPRGAGTGLEADDGTGDTRLARALELHVDANLAGEVLRRTGNGWQRAFSINVHCFFLPEG